MHCPLHRSQNVCDERRLGKSSFELGLEPNLNMWVVRSYTTWDYAGNPSETFAKPTWETFEKPLGESWKTLKSILANPWRNLHRRKPLRNLRETCRKHK